MKIKLTKPGGLFSSNSQTIVETNEIAAMQVNDEAQTVLTLRSGTELTVIEAMETIEKLCVEPKAEVKPTAEVKPPETAAS